MGQTVLPDCSLDNFGIDVTLLSTLPGNGAISRLLSHTP